MYSLYVETCGAGIGYLSDVDLKPFFQNVKYLEVPGIHISSDIPSNCCHFVYYKNNLNNRFSCDGNHIYIDYDYSELSISSIVRIGLVLLEKALGEQKKIILHSACVSDSNSATLFLGRSGSGKTTLSLNLCEKHHYSLMSNDRSIIGLDDNDQLCCYEGTKFFNLRYASILDNCPEYLSYFDKNNGDSWLNKKIVPSDKLGIDIEKRILTIQKAYLLHIDKNQQLLYNKCGDNLVNRLFLNELFQMGIRGMYSTFLSNDYQFIGYMPSLDNEELYSYRVQMMNYLLENNILEYVSGNIEDVSHYVLEKRKRDVLCTN